MMVMMVIMMMIIIRRGNLCRPPAQLASRGVSKPRLLTPGSDLSQGITFVLTVRATGEPCVPTRP
jgi:hypothetical protein